jgi:hypothetical protein
MLPKTCLEYEQDGKDGKEEDCENFYRLVAIDVCCWYEQCELCIKPKDRLVNEYVIASPSILTLSFQSNGMVSLTIVSLYEC